MGSFPVFVGVSLLLFVGILLFVLRRREAETTWKLIMVLAIVVVLGGMTFERYGAQWSWPWSRLFCHHDLKNEQNEVNVLFAAGLERVHAFSFRPGVLGIV